jgi:fumarate reductase subunit D
MSAPESRRPQMYWASVAALIVLVVGVCIPLGFVTQQYVAFGVIQIALCILWIVLFGGRRPRKSGR